MKSSTWIWIGLGALLLVLAVFGAPILGMLGLAGMHGLKLASTPVDHKPSFNVQLDVDLVVNGEPVLIKRIIQCKTVELRGGGDLASQFDRKIIPTTYYPTVGAIGHTFPDGSGVMMWTPYFCHHKIYKDANGKERIRPEPIPPGAMPFMAWTPNEKAFEPLEVYVSPEYFKQPYSRIKVNNVSVREAPEGAKPDPKDRYERFTQQKIKGENRFRRDFTGFTAISIPESKWRNKRPELDALLDSYDKPTKIPREILFGESRLNIFLAQQFDEIYSTCRTERKQERHLKYVTTAAWNPNHNCPYLDVIIPLEVRGNLIRINSKPKKIGFYILYSSETFRKPGAYLNIYIDDSYVFKYERWDGYIYDPSTKKIILFKKISRTYH